MFACVPKCCVRAAVCLPARLCGLMKTINTNSAYCVDRMLYDECGLYSLVDQHFVAVECETAHGCSQSTSLTGIRWTNDVRRCLLDFFSFLVRRSAWMWYAYVTRGAVVGVIIEDFSSSSLQWVTVLFVHRQLTKSYRLAMSNFSSWPNKQPEIPNDAR